MPPDFGPDGPGYGPPPGPGFEHHFHHGPPHLPMSLDWWPMLGSLLMTMLVLAVLWAAGLALLSSQVARGPRRRIERVDGRARWDDAV